MAYVIGSRATDELWAKARLNEGGPETDKLTALEQHWPRRLEGAAKKGHR